MESKKINQLATELAPELSDLTIIGDPTTGISKKITLSQMASLFTGTVEEYANLASFPLVGTADTIYIALDTNIIYRWNTGTSAYVELSPNIVTSLVFSDANGFDGTISLVGSTATLTITTALTTGSVPFIGASGALSQDNANLFFDDTNNRFGINTNTPTTALDVFGSGIIGRLNGTSTNNAFLGFASAGTTKWSIGNVQSDHRFRIYSEATTSELVSVLQTGEFGIGIANPLTKLHIFGGASALIANLDANTSVAKSISFRSGNSSRINLEVSGTESGSNAGADLFIRTYTDAGALLATPLFIKRSTGNIGVNLNNPQRQLHIHDTTGAASIVQFTNLDTGSGAEDGLLVGITANEEGAIILKENKPLWFATNDTERFRISATGGAIFTGDVELNGASGTRTLTIQNNTSGNAVLSLVAAGSNSGSITYNRSTSELIFANSGATSALKIAATGASIFGNNVGLGITPSTSTDPALQSRYGIFIGNDEINIINNGYFNSGFKYVQSGFFGNRYYQDGYNGGHVWYTAPSGTANATLTWNERMRISTSGNLEVRNDNANSYIYLTNTLNTSTINKNTVLQFRGTDTGNSIKDAGAIQVVPLGINYIDSNMIFYVRGSDTLIERMRIGSTVAINTTGAGSVSFVNSSLGTGTGNIYSEMGVNTNNTSSTHFVGAQAGFGNRIMIYGNGNIVNTNNSYGPISDIKLKENIVNTSPKLDKLMKVRIVNYNLIGDELKQIGVIAQELEQIFPGLVDETEDFKEVEITDKEGNITKEKQSLGTTTKSVKMSVFVPMLIKAMQEQQSQIEELKALINK